MSLGDTGLPDQQYWSDAGTRKRDKYLYILGARYSSKLVRTEARCFDFYMILKQLELYMRCIAIVTTRYNRNKMLFPNNVHLVNVINVLIQSS